MRNLLFLSFILALTACVSQPVEELSWSEKKQLAQEIIDRCTAQGVKKNTPEMKACSRSELDREIALRRKNYETRQRVAAGMAAAGQNIQSGARANTAVSCNSSRIGSQVYTNCY